MSDKDEIKVSVAGIESMVFANNKIVYDFQMMASKGEITETEALYGTINALAKENERMFNETLRLYSLKVHPSVKQVFSGVKLV